MVMESTSKMSSGPCPNRDPIGNDRRTTATPEHLYFIRFPDGPVKIGRSATPKFRLKTLQCGSPYELKLLGVVEGGGEHEIVFHRKLGAYHIRGEWYEWEPPVVAAVEAALGDGRWRTVFGIPEPDDLEYWFVGSPLYAGNPKYPQYQAAK